MKRSEPILLGIEAGGTKTIAIAATASLRQVSRIELGPANLRLTSDKQLVTLLRGLKRQVGQPAAIGIGVPGVRTSADEARVRRILKAVWPAVPAAITNDLELAIDAAELNEPQSKHLTKVVVLSGTGSCCFGRTADGRVAKVGGWGHLLGDKASGYDIALRGARAAVFYFDRDGEWSTLGTTILRHLSLNEPEDLIGWIQSADKTEIAAAAMAVFEAWKEGDRHAAEIIETSAHGLALDAVKCAARLENSDPTVQFVLAGSVLLKQSKFAELVGEGIRRAWPQAVVAPLAREAAWGGVQIAARALDQSAAPEPAKVQITPTLVVESVGLEASPTEKRNPRSMQLDKLSAREAIDLFIAEEKYVQRGLRKVAPEIARALTLVTASLKGGGRLFYVGAGTSGRLGILDASECPPTFRTDPELVQGIIAGGAPAIFRAVEGAEDDAEAGVRAVAFRGVKRGDVVIGIAASGRTPFVWGALRQAKKSGARVILLTFNPNIVIPKSPELDVLIAADVGPELLTGSTRLKSGTATKLILNMLTTLPMVKLGKVASNLMIDLNPSNVKLRDRAVRIVSEITGTSREISRQALERSGWVVKAAVLAAAKQPKKTR